MTRARRQGLLAAAVHVTASAVWLSLCATTGAQQVVDPNFTATVPSPAYKDGGPTVAIDEAHANFHTAGGQYKPFADLLSADGYRVSASTRTFEKEALATMAVLVIANARQMEPPTAGNLSPAAFTERECEAVRDWVQQGGSLLLVADHAPFGGAAANLALRFGVTMGRGWVFDRVSGGGITTQLEFTRANGLLGDHAILRGRASSEQIDRIRSFTGQSLGVPPEAAILMRLSDSAREAATADDLDAEDVASRQEATLAGSYSTAVAGRAQGLAMTFGRGRVVVLGEAGLLSAQVVRAPDGRETKMGMNVPGTDDQQFALNILHWLTGLL